MINNKLKNIGIFLPGLKNKKITDFERESNDKYIDFKSLLSKTINYETLPSVHVDSEENQNIVIKNDILINMTSENYDDIGNVAIYELDHPVYLNSFSTIFRCNDSVDPVYVYYLLQHSKYRNIIRKQAQGITRINLSPKRFSNIEVALHDIENQQKIGSFFKELDQKISYLNKVVDCYQNIEFYFVQQIKKYSYKTYKNSKLSDLATFINGKAHECYVMDNASIPLINSKYISSDQVCLKYAYKNICPAQQGDICMVMSDVPNGNALAKCCIAQGNEAVNQRIGIIRSSFFTPEVLLLLLNRNSVLLKYDNHISQTNLRKNDILNILVPEIPKTLQREIECILINIKTLTEYYSIMIQYTKKVKKYYMNIIFNS